MVLHINTSSTWRGGENQLFLLAKGLREKKIKQCILTQKDSELSKKCNESGFPFIEIKMGSEFDYKAILKIRKIIQEFNVKIVHTHTAKAHTFGLFTKILNNNFFLINSRRVDFRIKNNFFSKWKYHSTHNNLFLTVSHAIKDILLKGGVSPEKLITIHSGVSLENKIANPNSSKYLLKEFNVKKGTVIIGNVAALVDHKDQQTLLHAISLLNTSTQYLLFIIGEGELRTSLENLINQYDLKEKVILTGFRNDVNQFLNIFDIFTMSSKEEGLGTSILDAMTNYLPIVATDAGGIPEMIVPNEGGLLSKVGDATELALNLKLLIENKKLRDKLGKFNSKYVSKFSIENTVKKTEQVYFSLLGKMIYE